MRDYIKSIKAREILSGVGRPTVEAVLETHGGIKAAASVPSGTSRGKHEAYELYDGGTRFRGLGVKKAVENINEKIAPALTGIDICDQKSIDRIMLEMDGTFNKSNLGGNAILAVSMAAARAGSGCSDMPLYRYIGGTGADRLPMPIATVLAGGKHAPSPLDFEDYLYVFNGFDKFADALEALVETRYCLGIILKERYGDIPEEGGAFSPPTSETLEAFDIMLEAAEKAGFGGRVSLGLDVAGSEFYLEDKNAYKVAGQYMEAYKLLEYFKGLTQKYPLVFIEDPFEQDDFKSFAKLTSELPGIQIVGDDLFVTNINRINKGIELKACNTLLLKVNQIGTVTEACDAGLLSTRNNYSTAVSIRSSDTIDSFIADIAVGLGAKQIKLGSPVRGERNAKYNRLLEIEQELGKGAKFAKIHEL